MDGPIIDVREYPEFAAGHIAGSKLVPLGQLRQASESWDRRVSLTLVCKSGRRAQQASQILESAGFVAVSVLEGGVDAWRAAGKPLEVVERRPWSLERQVRASAGSLILITLALSFFVSHYFILATALVGAGLVFAGVTDTCIMGFCWPNFPGIVATCKPPEPYAPRRPCCNSPAELRLFRRCR